MAQRRVPRCRRLSTHPFIGLRNPSPHHELTYEWEGRPTAAPPRVSVVNPCFNYGLGMFPELELVEFSRVDDAGRFRRHRSLDELVDANYACGMFLLSRPVAQGIAPSPLQARAAFYEEFIRPGDLVFDVGANTGNRTEPFLAIGARVVAVEPQAHCAALLRERFEPSGKVVVVEQALSDAVGEATMYPGSADTLTTLSPHWIESTTNSGRFAGERSREGQTVPTTTLGRLVAEHGEPAFTKIDVESFEEHVLAGLDQHVPADRSNSRRRRCRTPTVYRSPGGPRAHRVQLLAG